MLLATIPAAELGLLLMHLLTHTMAQAHLLLLVGAAWVLPGRGAQCIPAKALASR